MYREDPCYPTLTEMEAILNTVDARSLTDYYRNVLQSAKIDVFYVGSLSAEVPRRYLQTYFAEWKAVHGYDIIPPTAEPSVGEISLTEEMPVAQGKLSMGFRTGVCADGTDDRVHTAMVLNEILGGSPASKLFMNVRERMSLCYYCSSSYNRYTGILTVSAGIETKNRAVAEDAIRQQLASIQAGDVSQTEFLAAKSALENAYRQIDDNPFELQSFYGNRALFGLAGDIDECRRRMAEVTLEQVVALAKEVFCDTVFFVKGTKADAFVEEEAL
jgi:predicted Zn-dependent peptidase